jgi:hypothetical protein
MFQCSTQGWNIMIALYTAFNNGFERSVALLQLIGYSLRESNGNIGIFGLYRCQQVSVNVIGSNVSPAVGFPTLSWCDGLAVHTLHRDVTRMKGRRLMMRILPCALGRQRADGPRVVPYPLLFQRAEQNFGLMLYVVRQRWK